MLLLLRLLLGAGGLAAAAQLVQKVDVYNFRMAESVSYIEKYVKKGALGTFAHERNVASVNVDEPPTFGQLVIRMNRDALYSMCILDLDAGDAKVTIPESDRFLSLSVISEGHDVFPCLYDAGDYDLTRDGCGCTPPCRSVIPGSWRTSERSCTALGTRYAVALTRSRVNASDAGDVDEARSVQDRLRCSQAGTPKWEPAAWDPTTLAEVREALLRLARSSGDRLPVDFGFFQGPEKVDSLDGLLSMAAGWGGSRIADQAYAMWQPPDAAADYVLQVSDVPVGPGGFCSLTLYSASGYMFAREPSIQWDPRKGELVTVVIAATCDGRAEPCLSTQGAPSGGWNLAFRIFLPAQGLLDRGLGGLLHSTRLDSNADKSPGTPEL